MPKGVKEPLTLSSVRGIGDISFHPDEERLQPLPEPLALTFRVIRNKHVGKEQRRGAFTALSHTGAFLRAETPLAAFDNLELLLPGQDALFCKVLSVDRTGALLRFTALPEGFTQLIDGIL